MSETNGCDCNSNFEEIEIPVPWGHISGKWWGPKVGQPILAMHGWLDNAGTFDALAPLLVARGHALLCIDYPGHGLSSRFLPGYLYYGFYDGIHVVRRIVKYFNWKKITMIGHSLGGAVAFLYAATYRLEVDRYICLDISSPYPRKDISYFITNLADSVEKILKFEEVKAESEELLAFSYEDMIDMVYKNYNESLTQKSCRVLMKRGARKIKNGKFVLTLDPRMQASRIGIMFPDQIAVFATRIRCKVMNIKGDPGLVDVFSPENYEKVLDLQESHAEVVERHIVPGTHHFHLNNPELIVDMIDNFLKLK